VYVLGNRTCNWECRLAELVRSTPLPLRPRSHYLCPKLVFTSSACLYLAPLDWPCALPLRVCSTLLVERSTPCPGQYSSSSESTALLCDASAPGGDFLKHHQGNILRQRWRMSRVMPTPSHGYKVAHPAEAEKPCKSPEIPHSWQARTAINGLCHADQGHMQLC
jgi:hypothetical protein